MGLLRLEKDHQQVWEGAEGRDEQKNYQQRKRKLLLCIGKEIIGLKLVRSSGTRVNSHCKVKINEEVIFVGADKWSLTVSEVSENLLLFLSVFHN